MIPINRGMALFLDFDGTLVDIDPDRDKPRIDDAQSRLLSALYEALDGALALVSGRSLFDLDKRATRAAWRVGSHGAETAPPHQDAPQAGYLGDPAILKAARDAAAALSGVEVEVKPYGAALHFRTAPQHGDACRAALAAAVSSARGYAIQSGKSVVEARPATASKGAALRSLAQSPIFAAKRPLAVGDDDTDETMFEAARALGGAGVKVGPGATGADFRIASPRDVWRWLAEAERALAAG